MSINFFLCVSVLKRHMTVSLACKGMRYAISSRWQYVIGKKEKKNYTSNAFVPFFNCFVFLCGFHGAESGIWQKGKIFLDRRLSYHLWHPQTRGRLTIFIDEFFRMTNNFEKVKKKSLLFLLFYEDLWKKKERWQWFETSRDVRKEWRDKKEIGPTNFEPLHKYMHFTYPKYLCSTILKI